LGSVVLETLLIGLVLGDGDCLLWGDTDVLLGKRAGGLRRSWELKASVKDNGICLVVMTKSPR
jgi:hypothetical protein